MTYTIYSIGGGLYLDTVFNFLAATASHPTFASAYQIALFAGIIIFGFKILVTQRLQGIGGYLLLLILFPALLAPTANVVVEDRVSYSAPVKIDNVPFGVAFIASTTTTLAFKITQIVETGLSTPNSLSFAETGFSTTSRLLAQSTRFKMVSQTLEAFLRDCIIQAQGIHIDVGELAENGDLISYFNNNTPHSLVFYDVKKASYVPCREGWEDIKNELSSEQDSIIASYSPKLLFGPDTSTPSAGSLNYVNGLDAFQSFIGNLSGTSTQTIRQNILINAVDDAVRATIAASGNNSSMVLYQTARQDAQTGSSYSAIFVNAMKWIPLMKTVLEMLYYALFPIAMGLLLTPIGTRVFSGYFGGFLWLASWEPIQAVLQSFVLKASSSYYNGVLSSGSPSAADLSITYANQLGLRAVEQDISVMAGSLLGMSAFLSLAIFLGPSRMASLATSMTNVSQGAAIQTGQEAATGNIGLGNTNLANSSYGQINNSPQVKEGRIGFTNRYGVTRSGPIGSQDPRYVTFDGGGAQSNTPFAVQAREVMSQSLQQQSSQARTELETSAQQVASTLTNTTSRYTNIGKSLAQSTNVSDSQSTGTTATQKRSAAKHFDDLRTLANDIGVSVETVMAAGLGANAGLSSKNIPSIFDVGASGNVSGKVSATDLDKFYRQASESQKRAVSNAVDRYTSVADSLSVAENTSSGQTQGEGKNYSQSQLQSDAETYQTSVQVSDVLQSALSSMKTESVDFNSNLNNFVLSSARKKGFTDAQISQAVRNQTDDDRVIQGQIMSAVEPELQKFISDTYDIGDIEGGIEHANLRQPRDLGILPPDPILSQATVDRAAGDVYQQAGVRRGSAQQAMEMLENQPAAAPQTPFSANVAAQLETSKTGRLAGALWNQVTSSFSASNGYTNPDIVPQSSRTYRDITNGGVSLRGTPVREPVSLSAHDRDQVIRTIAGEGLNETVDGQAAIANVIRNRVQDPAFPPSASGVVHQKSQFSAWNALDNGGNTNPQTIQTGSEKYKQIGQIVDQVFAGLVPDNTQGANHYYSPSGMKAMVNKGISQSEIPSWLDNVNQDRRAAGGRPITIGNHVFTGITPGGAFK